MDADSEYEIKLARDAFQMIHTIQSMIDVSADRLEGLRTQCSTSAELTQQEIRTLEGKLLKHFSRQLVIKARFGEELKRELTTIPCLSQWLRVVGLCRESIQAICSCLPTVETLRECSDHELRELLTGARDEEVRRLCRAMQRLRTYTDAIGRGEAAEATPLYWDSWERHGHTRLRHHRPSVPTDDDTCSTTTTTSQSHSQHSTPQPRKGVKSPEEGSGQLPAPAALTKSRSHEGQLCTPDQNHLSSSECSESGSVATTVGSGTPPASPRDDHTLLHHRPHASPAAHVPLPAHTHNNTSAPRSPRTPTYGRCMAHDIAHRFTKTFNMIATCDYCDKQMLFGAGLKCKECKFKCHRDCESKVPPSCGLPPEFVTAFREKFHKDGVYAGVCGSPGSGRAGFLSSLTHRQRRRHHPPANNTQPYPGAQGSQGGPDSSSNTSSCNSSTPSSPALAAPATPHHHHQHQHHQHPQPPAPTTKQQFHFPEVLAPAPSPAPSSPPTTDLTVSIVTESPRCASLSGSGSTDSGAARADSLDEHQPDPDRWPRQNSLSMKEWDIPYDELKLFDPIGRGRFGTVYRGSWHGAVAVKVLNVQYLSDNAQALDAFKHEVATFRKTRHENLVLFMGACMKPPRLAIVTSLCKGHTLYAHIHHQRAKLNTNRTVVLAQQISQGMSYLHARGIVHKDLKTKNIFIEGGKIVITDFGLFSVTKLCYGNNGGGDRLCIPAGWLCYLAPELVRALTPSATVNLPFTKASDVYAFGTVWYELVCGEWPLRCQPPEAVVWQVGRGMKQAAPHLPHATRDVKDVLALCWAYRPEERPQFATLTTTLDRVPRKRLARSPSHPVQSLSRSADSVF